MEFEYPLRPPYYHWQAVPDGTTDVIARADAVEYMDKTEDSISVLLTCVEKLEAELAECQRDRDLLTDAIKPLSHKHTTQTNC